MIIIFGLRSEKNTPNREEYYTVKKTHPREVIEASLPQGFKNELRKKMENKPALVKSYSYKNYPTTFQLISTTLPCNLELLILVNKIVLGLHEMII